MKAQLSLEILIGMAVTLLIAITLLHYFASAHLLITSTQTALSSVANTLGSYQTRLLAR